jgi:hypothetical protein
MRSSKLFLEFQGKFSSQEATSDPSTPSEFQDKFSSQRGTLL